VGAGAHDDAAATGLVTLADTGHAVDQAGRREVRGGNVGDQVVDADRRVFQHGQTAGNHFIEVVRRNIGRHAHRDTGRAVDQQIGDARRHDQRFIFGTVVVRPEIDRFLVEVFEQLMADLGHPDFGVTHGRRVVTVDRTEVALAIDQHVAQ
jgi:hypothetical protein